MSLRPEMTNLWGLRRRVLNFLIWAQKGSVANIIANSNKTAERIFAGMMDKAFHFLFFLFSVLIPRHRILAKASRPWITLLGDLTSLESMVLCTVSLK
jgi:hypothetical protein